MFVLPQISNINAAIFAATIFNGVVEHNKEKASMKR